MEQLLAGLFTCLQCSSKCSCFDRLQEMETKSTTQAKYADGVNLVPHHLTQLYTIDQLNDILQTHNPKTVGAPDHTTCM